MSCFLTHGVYCIVSAGAFKTCCSVSGHILHQIVQQNPCKLRPRLYRTTKSATARVNTVRTSCTGVFCSDKEYNKYRLLARATESCCRQSLTISAINYSGRATELGGIVNSVDRRRSSSSRSERPPFSSYHARQSIYRSEIF